MAQTIPCDQNDRQIIVSSFKTTDWQEYFILESAGFDWFRDNYSKSKYSPLTERMLTENCVYDSMSKIAKQHANIGEMKVPKTVKTDKQLCW